MASDRYIFIASCLTSLEDFLKTDISKYNYIYCQFKKRKVGFFTQHDLNRKGIIHISYSDTPYSSIGINKLISEQKLPHLIKEVSELSTKDRESLLNHFNNINNSNKSILTEDEYCFLMSTFQNKNN